MKHQVLLTFHTTKPLPADFLDVIAGRIYTLELVNKQECTATLITDFDDGEELPAILRKQAA